MKRFLSLPTNERLYIIFADISLVMYIFGHSTEWGRLPFPDKLFYVPCAITLFIALLDPRYRSISKSDILFLFFWVITFLNTIVSVDISFETIFNSLIGFLIFRHLSIIDDKMTIRLLFYCTPFVVMLHYLYSNPLALAVGYRYGGFQGDPNCFSFAMNILLYTCGYMVNYSDARWQKILSVICILFIFPLLLAAASRGNIAIASLILLYSFKDTLKNNKLLALVVILAGLFYGGKYVARFTTQFETVTNRYSVTESGSEYRTQELSIVPNVLFAHPKYLLLGIGYNESLNAHARFPEEYYHKGRCHNSYMSILLEEGIVGFILFMCFLYQKGKIVWNRRKQKDGKYRLVMMFAIMFFFYTIYCLPFLPFWFILNLISNNSDELYICS